MQKGRYTLLYEILEENSPQTRSEFLLYVIANAIIDLAVDVETIKNKVCFDLAVDVETIKNKVCQ